MSSPTSLPLPFVHPDQIEEEAKITQIEFYKTKPIKLVAYYILSVLTIGVVPLLCLLKPKVRVFFKCTEASTSDAQYVIAANIDGIFEHKTLISREFFFSGQRKFCKSFMFRYYTYYFDEEDGLYKPCQFSLEGKTYNSIHKEMGTGMPSMMTIEQRLITYGPNTTDIPMKSNWSTFFKEILTPYYLFQLYTIVIWGYYSDYPIYAGISLAASLILLIAHCFEAKNIMTKICQQAHYETEVRVYRPSEDEEERNSQVPGLINSAYLVPGDLIEISHGKKLPCDVILLSGTCVMNENMLTGESTLLNKTPLPRSEKVFNYWTAKKHILFAGTECVETIKTELEPQIVGVVIRTGFLTMKGRIIRSFLCAKKDKSQLYKDSMKYMAIMVLIGLIFVFVGLHVMIQQEEGKFGPIFKRCVDLIIVVVPPILTTFLSLGLLISTLRLKLNNVLTTSELKITLAGRVQMVCFDKTGTLTNNTLDLHGVKGVSRTAKNKLKFEPMIKNNIHASLSCSSEKSSSHLLLEVMATCHNLTSVENTFLGEMLDIKMVEAIGWQIYNQDEHGARVHAMKPPSDLSDDSYYKLTSELSIIKRFPFSPKLQRMTVISKDPREPKQRMNIKGVPEIIRKLCQPKTIPDDFDDILYYYTRNGFKVVACATKLLKDQVRISDNLSREFFEKDLEFLGFLIFENKIRESAPIAIAELSEAEIPTLMMTGDNSTAALLTARLCGIINKNHKIAMATLGSASDGDDSSLNRIKWTWMGSPHKEEMGGVFEPPETHYVLELGDTEHNVLMKGSDTNDMRSFLENLRLDHRAVIVITGDAFKYLEEQLVNEPALFKSLVNKMKIFSQLNSDDKAIVIRELQKQGNVVAMVGNGVSACQALQTADISIAITDSEATLVSSFLNKAPDLRCVPMILREGRAALVTSFQVSKYMALYCLIQVYSVVAISLSWTWFSNPTFLYMDLFIIIPTAFTLLLTKPMDKLSKGKPPGFLVSVPVLVSVIGQTVIQLVACVLTIKILHVQSWYKSPLDFRESVSQSLGFEFGGDVADYDNTVVFLLGNIQFMALVMAFSIGKPFRKPFFQNYLFMVVFLVTCIMSILIILVKIPRLIDLLHLIAFEPEHNFKWILLAITAVNAVATFAYEKLFVQKVANFTSKVLEKFKKKAKLSAYEF